MVVTAEKDIVSSGVLASRTQRTVRTIEKTAEAIGVAPSLKINGVDYWDGVTVEKLTAAFKGEQQ